MPKLYTYPVKLSVWLFLLLSVSSYAQQEEEQLELEREHRRLMREAGADLKENDFVEAEVDLRKAIAILPKDETGKYNLGTAYYDKALNEEAMKRFSQAAEVAGDKAERHKAFHNLGNTYMNAKNYEQAVEAYKNALRNNPADEETRYNLALAKDMLKKNPPQGGDDDNKDDQNKQDQNQDQQENQDQKDNEQDKQDKQDEQDQGEDQENEDQGDQEDQDKEGDKQQEQNKKPKEGDQDNQKKEPTPGQLSPQQIQNLLEAMNNEEKKVQDKINARKRKGAKVKSNKDW
jgi:tetratricopeptide (TPR) repeat protein